MLLVKIFFSMIVLIIASIGIGDAIVKYRKWLDVRRKYLYDTYISQYIPYCRVTVPDSFLKMSEHRYTKPRLLLRLRN